MTSADPELSAREYTDLAESAWRWVLDQVRWDDGPWIPTTVSVGPAPERADGSPPWDRDGVHSGVGGLAQVLAEIRLARAWTGEESELAAGIADRVRSVVPDQVDCTLFDGLVSTIGTLTALGAPGSHEAVARLAAIATPDGWPQTFAVPPRFLPDARINDITLGTAGILLGAIWARRAAVAGTPPGRGQDGEAHDPARGALAPEAQARAHHAAAVLIAEREPLPTGSNWPHIPSRFRTDAAVDMPNFSHGLAGIAAALAVAGLELGRPDLVAAARSGAEHLVTLGDTSGGGFVVPRLVPTPADRPDDPVTYTWCHGPTGTSLLFAALHRADVDDVAGDPPLSWQRRCLHSVRTSGVPARLRPGFWDNDGRCCGTAGVGDAFLDSWQRDGDAGDLDVARRMADVLVERAVRVGDGTCWRFLEHRAAEPLLPPQVGWMQGAAGIAAFLFRDGRLLQQGRGAPAAERMDSWWALPDSTAGPALDDRVPDGRVPDDRVPDDRVPDGRARHRR
jgi:hypothetical protein